MLLLAVPWSTVAAILTTAILWLASLIILAKSFRMSRQYKKMRDDIFDKWSFKQESSQNLLPKTEELASAIKNNCESAMLGAALYLAGGLLLGLVLESNFFAGFSVFYFVWLYLDTYLQKAKIKSLKKMLTGEEEE